MKRNAAATTEREQPLLTVNAEWSAGPRTPAWDRLWRAMLRGLEVEPVAEATDQLGREGDDG